jgi:serine/threonine protein kinase
VVYQAIDTVRAERTAIKLLAPAFAGDQFARTKVHQEAVITERLRHPSVPKVFGFGDAWLPDGNVVPYVAMELLTGSVLAGRLAGGALPWREAVAVAATVADVLAIAHRRGVVHRDLTPANIMMTANGPKIIDFGEATTVEPTSMMARAKGPLPIRMVSSAASPADDVYALGVVLYQMLTGRSPYPGGPEADLAAARLRHIAPTPVLLVPDLPRAVAEICRSSMAKRPQERPDSHSLAVALWSLLVPAADRAADAEYPFSWWQRRDARRAAPARPATPPAPPPDQPPVYQPGVARPVAHRAPARRPAPRHAAVPALALDRRLARLAWPAAEVARSGLYSIGYG